MSRLCLFFKCQLTTYDAARRQDVTSNLISISFALSADYSGQADTGLVVPIVMGCDEMVGTGDKTTITTTKTELSRSHHCKNLVQFTGSGVNLLSSYKTWMFWMSPHGCACGASQEVHPTTGESLKNPFRSVPACRRDTGIFLLRRASRPSMARSVADVLSAHGPRRKIPVSRLEWLILKGGLARIHDESNRILD
jgi:hypothetical protein